MAKGITKRSAVTSVLIVTISLIGIIVGRNFTGFYEWFIRANGQKADLVIYAGTPEGSLNRSWQNIAQGGEESEYRFFPVSQKASALEPEYIRIDHIYDFYDVVSRSAGGQLVFDWRKLDTVIADIQGTGATPFISLSYMPSALGSDLTGNPNNWTEWQLVVQRTIEHISGRSGLNIENVYYEVWNEPDLFGEFKTYGSKNYLTLYTYAALGAANAQSTQGYSIGGPAITAMYPNWVRNMFNHVSTNNLRFDFFSWHRYHYDVDQYLADIKIYDEIIADYPEYLFSTERLITEWGPDSDINAVYDNNLSAAHMIAVTAQINNLVNRAFVFELQDGKDPAGKEYWGRWGLLTHQDFGSKIKPRYQAMQMLNQLGPNRLTVQGQGTWVKAIAAQTTAGNNQVLITNYDPRGKNVEEVPIRFEGLEDGIYRLTQNYLGRGTNQTITIQAINGIIVYSLPLAPNMSVLVDLTFLDNA